MLLKTYWSMLTRLYGHENRVGVFWKTYFPFTSSMWGLTDKNAAKAWQNHKIQPARGFFSKKHTKNDDSLNELFEGFCNLTKKEPKKINIHDLAVELFESDEAKPICTNHRDKVDALLSDIKRAADNDWETAVAITAVFWFCFSLRPRNKETYNEWRGNPDHEIPIPENRYLQLLSWLYIKKYRNYFPEDQWVLNLSTGRPNKIVPVMNEEGVEIEYNPETGFTNVPSEWQDLLTIQKDYPNLLKESYEALNNLPYTSPIVGIMQSQYITCDPPKVICQYYKVDYKVHRLREEVVKKLRSNSPDWMKKLSLNAELVKEKDYGWLRTSLGVNVIIEIPSAQALILHFRGKDAEYGNAGKIYPSIVETIDLVETHNDFSLENVDPITACVTRGLKEELGIPDCIREKDCIQEEDICYTPQSIKHVAFARTLDFDQDNFFTIVKLNDNVNFDRIKDLAEHAKEHRIEIKDVFTISNQPEKIVTYMFENADQMIHQTRYALWLYIIDRLKTNR